MAAHPLTETETCELVTGFSFDRVVVLDTETTGLEPGSDEVLSIGICDGWGKRLLSCRVKPAHHRSWPGAEAVNGISPEMVRNAPAIGEVAPEVRDHLLGNKVIVGYNIGFDIDMLLGEGVLQERPQATFDVMREYALVHGESPSPHGRGYRYTKLAACAAHYGYKFHAHDSMEDAIATLWCFRGLLVDPVWLHTRLDGMAERLRSVSISQTKETTGNVLELVDAGVTTRTEAVLRLGTVSRGKSAGKPRYELFVQGRKAGHVTPAAMEKLRIYLQVGEGEDMPDEVPCTAIISAAGAKAHATVELVSSSNVISAAYDGASITRSSCGNAWTETIPEQPATHAAPSPSAHAKTAEPKDRSTLYGCLMLLGMAALCIWALMALVSCVFGL